MFPRFGGSIMAVRRNAGGRPSKFTTPDALAVVAELARGGSLEAAAKSAGVGLSTVYRWLDHGRRGDPRFTPLAVAVPAATSAGKTALAYHRLWASPWRSLFTGKRRF